MGAVTSHSLSDGPLCRKFEALFAKKIGTRYAAAVTNGTAGLHLALLAAGVGPGDEVITSPFSFIASANAIVYTGARPAFCDIDLKTLNIDPAKIEEKITPKTKAILAVHIFHQVAEMDKIMAVARKHKLVVIEDACEVVGASYRGKPAGSFGQSAVFGFFPNKQITAGEGGMIVTNNTEVYETICSLRNQGKTQPGSKFEYDCVGYNYRMNEMSAALGISQFGRIDTILKRRNRIAKTYSTYLDQVSSHIAVPTVLSGSVPSWFAYAIRIINPAIDRQELMQCLAREGIDCRPRFPSIHLQKEYQDRFGYKTGDFPNCESASRTCLTLPFYLGLADADIKQISKVFVGMVGILADKK